MGRCSAHNCTNSDENGFKIHRFPTDKKRRLQWAVNVNRLDLSGRPGTKGRLWIPGPGACHVICEAHFTKDQYEPRRPEKRLKSSAVPTIFAPPDNIPLTSTSRSSKSGRPKPGTKCDKSRKVVFDYWHTPAKRKAPAARSQPEIPKRETPIPASPENTEEHDHCYASVQPKAPAIEQEQSDSKGNEVQRDSASESEFEMGDLGPNATDIGPKISETDNPNLETRDSYSTANNPDSQTGTSLCKTCNLGPVIGVPEVVRISRPIVDWSVRTTDSIRLDLEQEVLRLRQQLNKRCCELVKLRKANAGMRAKLHRTNVQLQESSDYLGTFLRDDQIRHLRSKSKKGGSAWCLETVEDSRLLLADCGSKGYSALLSRGYPLPALRTLRKRLQYESGDDGCATWQEEDESPLDEVMDENINVPRDPPFRLE